jgi:hypothetical protein
MTSKGSDVMLEDYLIEYCSPTLASLKPANLFNNQFTSHEELDGQLAEWNRNKIGQRRSGVHTGGRFSAGKKYVYDGGICSAAKACRAAAQHDGCCQSTAKGD